MQRAQERRGCGMSLLRGLATVWKTGLELPRVYFRLGVWRRRRGLKPPSDMQSALKRTAKPVIAPFGNQAPAGFPCQTPVSTGGQAASASCVDPAAAKSSTTRTHCGYTYARIPARSLDPRDICRLTHVLSLPQANFNAKEPGHDRTTSVTRSPGRTCPV